MQLYGRCPCFLIHHTCHKPFMAPLVTPRGLWMVGSISSRGQVGLWEAWFSLWSQPGEGSMEHGHMPVQPLTIAFSLSSQMQADYKPDPWAAAGKVMLLGVRSINFHGKSRSGVCCLLALCWAEGRAAGIFLQLLKVSCLFSVLLGQSWIPSSNGSQIWAI